MCPSYHHYGPTKFDHFYSFMIWSVGVYVWAYWSLWGVFSGLTKWHRFDKLKVTFQENGPSIKKSQGLYSFCGFCNLFYLFKSPKSSQKTLYFSWCSSPIATRMTWLQWCVPMQAGGDDVSLVMRVRQSWWRWQWPADNINELDSLFYSTVSNNKNWRILYWGIENEKGHTMVGILCPIRMTPCLQNFGMFTSSNTARRAHKGTVLNPSSLYIAKVKK